MPATTTSVKPKWALALFIAIIIISIIIACYMKTYERFNQSGFHIFTTVLVALGIFVTFLFYYGVVELQQQQQQLAFVQETARISNNVLENIMDEIKNSAPIIPNFTNSINPLTTCQDIIVPPDPINTVTCTNKSILSYKIFNVWQDVILSNAFVYIDPEAYITNFLQRAHSEQLYEQWKIGKINFNSRTQSFGELLFEYGMPIVQQTPDAYVAAAQHLIADPRFLAIVK